MITTLQRERLPPGLPVWPGTQIAGSYLLVDADTASLPTTGWLPVATLIAKASTPR